jgi:anaerobic magnesium-protoporphyrin IX monomethyl ester cyclase
VNVTLINPPSGSVYSKFQRAVIKRLPLGLSYIAAYLARNGHDVNVVDAEALDLTPDEAVLAALQADPEMVGVTATTPIIHSALHIIRQIKMSSGKVHTMLGGPHASAMPEETLRAGSGYLDYVIFGEGEKSALDVVNAIEKGIHYRYAIDGVAFLDHEGNVIRGEDRPFEEDLDSYPMPARSLFPMERYLDKTKFGEEPYTLVTTSRGCPYSCTFCGSQTTWKRTTRFRSPENVLQEIRECVERYGIRNFVFVDDTFTLQRKRTIDICRKISELPYAIRIFCSSRANTISEDRLYWLKKAGCYCLSFGLESGSDAVLGRMRKGITVNAVRKALAMTKKAGVATHGSFIIGYDGETEDTIEETIRFSIDLGLDQAQFSILVPFPGTECFDIAKKRSAFRCPPDDFTSFYWYYSVPANLTHVSDERLLTLQKEAYERWNASKNGHGGPH